MSQHENKDVIGQNLTVGSIIAWPASGYRAGSGLVVGTIKSIEPRNIWPLIIAETLKGRTVDVSCKDVALIGHESTTKI